MKFNIFQFFQTIFLSKFFLILLFTFSFFSLPTQTFAQNIDYQNCKEVTIDGPNKGKYECPTSIAVTTLDGANTGIETPGAPEYKTKGEVDKGLEAFNKERARQEAEAKNKLDGSSGCVPIPGYGFSPTKCLVYMFTSILYYFFYAINLFLELVLNLASFIFDLTVYFTIVKFKTNFADLKFAGAGGLIVGDGGGDLIYYLWGIIRDFLNILIFITVMYHAMRSMFEGFEDTRKKFVTLLVFSIVANFSLLFVKVAIDVSNILALQAYTLGVQPSGTDNITQFRTTGSTDKSSPSGYGEYIKNSISFGYLKASSKTGAVGDVGVRNGESQEDYQKRISVGGEKETQNFMFELGKIISYLGIIYLLLFMTGILLARAAYLLFAMILSPLIACDIFFGLFDKNNAGGEMLKAIKSVTDRVKGDFYDALIKGPVIIFFVYIIGLLASTVLGQSAQDSIEKGLSSGGQNFNPALITALFVTFKFALFFLMCKEILSRLNNINFGSGALNNFGSKFAGKSFGLISGLPGAAGRRFARNLGSTTSVLGKRFSGFRDKMTTWQDTEQGGIRGWAKNRIGERGNRVAIALRNGSYEATKSKLGAKLTGSKLGQAINEQSGIFNNKKIKKWDPVQGKYVDADLTGSFDSRDSQRLAARQAEVDREKKIIQEAQFVSPKNMTEARNETMINVKGDKPISVADFSEILKDRTKLEGKSDAFKTFFEKTQEKNSDESKEVEDKQRQVYEEAVKKSKKDGEKAAKKLAAGNRKTIMGQVKDKIRGSYVERDLGRTNRKKQSQDVGKQSGIIKQFISNIETAKGQYNLILTGSGLKQADINSIDKLIREDGSLKSPIKDQDDVNSFKLAIQNKMSPGKEFYEIVQTLKKNGLTQAQAEAVIVQRGSLSSLENRMKADMISKKNADGEYTTTEVDAASTFEKADDFRKAYSNELKESASGLRNIFTNEEYNEEMTTRLKLAESTLSTVLPQSRIIELNAELEALTTIEPEKNKVKIKTIQNILSKVSSVDSQEIKDAQRVKLTVEPISNFNGKNSNLNIVERILTNLESNETGYAAATAKTDKSAEPAKAGGDAAGKSAGK